MSDFESWVVRGVVGALLAALAGLFLRVRTNETRLAVMESTMDTVGLSEDDVDRRLAELRLYVSEHYVRRDDYVTNESRVIGLLEKHSIMLARLEERMGPNP